MIIVVTKFIPCGHYKDSAPMGRDELLSAYYCWARKRYEMKSCDPSFPSMMRHVRHSLLIIFIGTSTLLILPVGCSTGISPSTSGTNTISTVVGNYELGGGYSGDDGPSLNAQLNQPSSIAVDSGGDMYVADSSNQVVRKIDAAGRITTVAGNHSLGPGYSGDGGSAIDAQLNGPVAVALDGHGNLFIAEQGNSVIRKVDSAGRISTIAGNYSLGPGYDGDGAGAVDAQLNQPMGIAIDPNNDIFIADSGNSVIRKVDGAGQITTVAGNYAKGPGYSGDGGQAVDAQLRLSRGLAVDTRGNLFIADTANDVIRKVDSSGKISTVAGNGSSADGYSGDQGQATAAQLRVPLDVAVDAGGNILIADTDNNLIRRVDSRGVITTIAGNHDLIPGYGGDGGPATAARLATPWSVAIDRWGNVLVADTSNNVIRKLSKQ